MSERAPLAGRFPLSAAFEFTARCNLRCKMCFIRVDERRIRELGARELAAAEWISLSRQAADMGTLNLLLTGGEPMLRPDFPEIYEAVMGMGFFITLYTNATLITPEIRELLTRLPPHKIGVTLYGASPETYERTCGIAAGYERALEGISFLNGLPSKLEIRTTLVKSNVGDMEALREIASSFGEGVSFTVSSIVSRAIRGGLADVEACRLSPDEHYQMICDCVSGAISHYRRMGIPEGIKQLAEEAQCAANEMKHRKEFLQETIFGCSAGMKSYTVTWNGRLISCQMMNEKGTAPLDVGLVKAWEEYPETVSMPLPAVECVSCPQRERCFICAASWLAETGPGQPMPMYNCKLTEIIQRKGRHDV